MRVSNIATCVGCGCDDLNACMRITLDPCRPIREPCHWLRVDRDDGTGVCSCCPDHLARYDAGDHSLRVRIVSA